MSNNEESYLRKETIKRHAARYNGLQQDIKKQSIKAQLIRLWHLFYLEWIQFPHELGEKILR
jgi:hypothetical protein